MKCRFSFFILCSVVLCTGGCDLFKNEQEFSFKNPVYATVYFIPTSNGGRVKRGIVSINYDNPNEFKLLVSDSSTYFSISLSPGRKKLFYGDESIGGSDPALSLFDIVTKTKTVLFTQDNTTQLEYFLFGSSYIKEIWNRQSDGFYFKTPAYYFTGASGTAYYDLTTQTPRIIRYTLGGGCTPYWNNWE